MVITIALGNIKIVIGFKCIKNLCKKNMVSFIDISILPFYKFYFMKLTQLCLLLLQTNALFLFKKEAFAIFIVQMKTRKIPFTFRVFWVLTPNGITKMIIRGRDTLFKQNSALLLLYNFRVSD